MKYETKEEKNKRRFSPYTPEEREEILFRVYKADILDTEERIKLRCQLENYRSLYKMKDEMKAERMKSLSDRLREAADSLDDY